jgi:hypothetical protein
VGCRWVKVRRGGGWAYEEHGEVAGSHDCGAGDNGVAGYGEHHQHADVQTAVACGACRPGYSDGDEESCEPDWNGGLALTIYGVGMMIERTRYSE